MQRFLILIGDRSINIFCGSYNAIPKSLLVSIQQLEPHKPKILANVRISSLGYDLSILKNNRTRIFSQRKL